MNIFVQRLTSKMYDTNMATFEHTGIFERSCIAYTVCSLIKKKNLNLTVMFDILYIFPKLNATVIIRVVPFFIQDRDLVYRKIHKLPYII